MAPEPSDPPPWRKPLQDHLKALADNVYFQPPSNITMQYPCIVYELETAETRYADNVPYQNFRQWQVTYISYDPDSDVPDKIAELPMCSRGRRFTADNLYHDVFTLFFMRKEES